MSATSEIGAGNNAPLTPSLVTPNLSGAEANGAARRPAWPFSLFENAASYQIDTMQRVVLFMDTLRKRGNQAVAAAKAEALSVLSFDAELIMDGRNLQRPVNYRLFRINPPENAAIDPAKRPFIVFDPRAGHGPGIGGMKPDSEIGAAFKAGHPCYFVGFLPAPVPGQTIEDVCLAEAEFLRRVTELHPDAPAAPALIGNCQAGWQIMMMAALKPDLPGPILIAGAPLSYWAGNRGVAPLRYLGGLLGGTWMTALAGDLGAGIFDGAALIANFESMNPANTYFTKNYNLLDRVDTEAERYLSFEAWWGNPVLLNAGEMQWIADNLFVGNRLSTGRLHTADGIYIDLRNIRSPIVVFCSWGDDITPPPQALGWILDLYDTRQQIVDIGQTIVYAVHKNIGHLGIFVSGKVATKEHGEFASCMDMIDLMPPGLYEAVIEDVGPDTAHAELTGGQYIFRLEARDIDDIRALGMNSAEDDLKFATANRVSEINNGLYRTLLQPAIKAMVTPDTAEAMRKNNRHRRRYAMFSDENPAAKALAPIAEAIWERRLRVSDDNPYRRLEHITAGIIETSLKNYGNLLDMWKEASFHMIYGNPILQAAVGMRASNIVPYHRLGRSVMREAAAAKNLLELQAALNIGDPVDALLRSINYIHRAERAVDERSFASLAQFQHELAGAQNISFGAFKQKLRTQALLVGWNAEAALDALPNLLPADPAARDKLLEAVRRVANVVGSLSGKSAERLARIEAIFKAKPHPVIADPTEALQAAQ